jgi:hypothetical protein
MMLRPVVIGDDIIHRIPVRRASFFNYQHSTLNSQPDMVIAQGWEISPIWTSLLAMRFLSKLSTLSPQQLTP